MLAVFLISPLQVVIMKTSQLCSRFEGHLSHFFLITLLSFQILQYLHSWSCCLPTLNLVQALQPHFPPLHGFSQMVSALLLFPTSSSKPWESSLPLWCPSLIYTFDILQSMHWTYSWWYVPCAYRWVHWLTSTISFPQFPSRTKRSLYPLNRSNCLLP